MGMGYVSMQAWGSGIQHFGMYQVTMGLAGYTRATQTHHKPSMQCNAHRAVELKSQHLLITNGIHISLRKA